MKINNEKYILLDESLKAIKSKAINILTLYGSPGVGKTHTAIEYLKEQEINYTYINSYSTPLSFFEILYNSRKKEVVIFDDVQGVANPLILSMLKSACWTSDGKRIISYHSTSNKMDTLGLPVSFEFNANVILIFNQIPEGYEPITNRGITIEFDFSFEEKIKIFEGLKDVINKDVLDYVKLNCNDATTNLSIRSMVILSNLKKSGRDFKLFAKEILKQDENKALLLTMDVKEWCDTTGMHRATYYRHKHKLGLSDKSRINVATMSPEFPVESIKFKGIKA